MSSHVRLPKITKLSRFFDENTYLVAGMCSRCYQENTEVRIVAVNRRFLKQVEFRKRNSDEPPVDNVWNTLVNSDSGAVSNGTNSSFIKIESEKSVNTSVEYSQTFSNNCDSPATNDSTDVPFLDVEFVLKSDSDCDIDVKDAVISYSDSDNSKYFKSSLNSKRSLVLLKPIKKDEEKCTVVDTEKGENCFKEDKPSNSCPSFFKTKYNTAVEIIPSQNSNYSYEPPWHPPRSPHNLIEESLYADPWSLLVATIFLNKTSCMLAKPYIEWFLSDFPTPIEVLKQEPVQLEKYFTTIGLKKRAHQVWRMSHDFLHKDWRNVGELHGIGKYGHDAFNMFCLGNLQVEPEDRFLKIYKAWFNMTQKEEKHAEHVKREDASDSEDSGFEVSREANDRFDRSSDCDAEEVREF